VVRGVGVPCVWQTDGRAPLGIVVRLGCFEFEGRGVWTAAFRGRRHAAGDPGKDRADRLVAGGGVAAAIQSRRDGREGQRLVDARDVVSIQPLGQDLTVAALRKLRQCQQTGLGAGRFRNEVPRRMPRTLDGSIGEPVRLKRVPLIMDG
jgi:hypothetical protein